MSDSPTESNTDAPTDSGAGSVSSGPVDPPAQPEVITPDEVETGRPTTGPTAPTHLDRLPAERDEDGDERSSGESVTEPGKVMRIGSMIKQLLEEVRSVDLDEASRERLAEVYERSVAELCEALSADLQEELRGLALPFDHEEVPSEAELRVAKAQLVGWLEGLFHGIQASLMAQQFAAQQQLQQMRELPGQAGPQGAPGQGRPAQPPQTGTYL